MPSHLRQSSPLASPISAVHSIGYLHPQPPAKKQKMSITQTYFLAHTARGKLSTEAARGDHDLRLLVGHANLLDSLMLDLQDAEREQEAWFNETVNKQSQPIAPVPQTEEPRRVSWVDSIVETIVEEDESSDDNDSDADDYESDDDLAAPRAKSPQPMFRFYGGARDAELEDEDDMATDDEDDMEDLQLVRTPSHSHPPELVSDDSSDEESEDLASPKSPPADLQVHGIKTRDFASASSANQTLKKPVLQEGFYNQQSQPMVAAF